MKGAVVKLLKKALKSLKIEIDDSNIERLIEIPPNQELGDYAFPCFSFSNRLEPDPHDTAVLIREKIGEPTATEFEDIQVTGPYINFFVNRKSLARQVVWDIISKKKEYGSTKIGKKSKVIVEFSSPNIAKPFGIGHLRSTIIGNSLSNILEFAGHKVTRINYLGDWGTQFGKLILGYKKFGSEKKLDKKLTKHLFEIYVEANKKKYEGEARQWFKKMEDGDKSTLLLWKFFKEISMENFKEIYKTLGIKFDAYESESMFNKKSREVIKEMENKGLLQKSKGALIVDLNKWGLENTIIEKSDGATLYITRDLAAAIDRHNSYKFDRMLYEVGQEQKLYFKQLFKILELLGYSWAKNCVHVEHGLYLDKKGKKFSTRKGKTIFLEEILEKTKSLAEKEIKKRIKKISGKELEKRSMRVAMAAIFYGDLKNNRKSDMIFDTKKFISFEGDTGPYLIYSYARASSILRKSAATLKKFELEELEEKEIGLVRKLSQFPDAVAAASQSLNPSVIAAYSYQLAQIFNEFYHACKVLGSSQETFRLALVEAFRQVLKNSLGLLGIETIEEM
ncbi:MAG: arginine--tRNA ligase [Nanoarchaeota archaeon]